MLITMIDSLRMVPPLSVLLPAFWTDTYTPLLPRLLTSAHAAFQLAALQRMGSTLHPRCAFLARNRAYLGTPMMLTGVRAAASSADPFVYAAANALLHALDEPTLVFRARAAAAAAAAASDPARAAAWSVEQVAQWVAAQPFRCFRSAFRDNFVTGRTLLSLSEEDLVAIGVAHPIHRRTMLFAIGDLVAAGGGVAGGGVEALDASRSGGGSVGSPVARSHPLPLSPSSAGASATYDVFISYRRVGGADFAQLLKLLLKAEGLNVFLDVENLGSGDFATQLVNVLRASSNVLLVWSRGCMDRFLLPEGVADAPADAPPDFLLMEYANALRMGKSVVPVYKEDFVFPLAERLPVSVRGVLSLNAVKFVAEYRDASLRRVIESLKM